MYVELNPPILLLRVVAAFLGFVESLTWDNYLLAEFSGVLRAVEIAKSKGWSKLWVGSDSSSVVNIFNFSNIDLVPWQVRNRWSNDINNLSVKTRSQQRETDSVTKIVYPCQRKKIETIREVIEIDPEVNFANQEGEIDSRHEDAIGRVTSIFLFNSKSIPRRPRTKCKRKFKGNEALSRSKEKLNSEVFAIYLEKIWKSFSNDRKKSFAYLDSLWFSLYRNASSRDKVLSWINKEHIFTKAYVFVPIVCWGHWNLLIFCNFGENLQSRCMLLLDSLEMTNPRRLEPEIRRFVQDIYKAAHRPETKRLISQIPLLVPKVPQQKDGTECGNFVLYFIKLFLELAPDNFSMEGYPYFMKKDWFTFKELDQFCESLTR